jgi:hypothetical protein
LRSASEAAAAGRAHFPANCACPNRPESAILVVWETPTAGPERGPGAFMPPSGEERFLPANLTLPVTAFQQHPF